MSLNAVPYHRRNALPYRRNAVVTLSTKRGRYLIIDDTECVNTIEEGLTSRVMVWHSEYLRKILKIPIFKTVVLH